MLLLLQLQEVARSNMTKKIIIIHTQLSNYRFRAWVKGIEGFLSETGNTVERWWWCLNSIFFMVILRIFALLIVRRKWEWLIYTGSIRQLSTEEPLKYCIFLSLLLSWERYSAYFWWCSFLLFFSPASIRHASYASGLGVGPRGLLYVFCLCI